MAVIGLGYWGPNLLRVLIEMGGVQVKWGCDQDPDRLDRFGRRYPNVSFTTEYADVLEDPEVDAVLIATPVGTHVELARQSLEAGKHTFVEKPLAPSTEMADELIALADDAGRVLMPGHTFIYSPPVRAAKELLDRGELGDVYFVSSSRVNLGLHQRDVSVVWDLGPHDFSILLYWLGELPRTVRTVGRASIVDGIPDVAFVALEFSSGIVANIELSWLSPSKLRRTVIVGSEKMAVYDDGSPEPIKLYDQGVVYRDPETFGEYHLSYRTGDVLAPKLDTYEPLGAELGAFAEAIRSGDRLETETTLARDVVSLTEAADRSLREGGAEVLIERRRVFGRALAANDRARRELGEPLPLGGSSAPGPDDADERRMQAVLLIGAADPPDGAIRALLEETLPYQRIVEAEHASAALVAADVEGHHLSLALVACDSEEVDAGAILAGLSEVCPQVPVLLWSNSLESRDIRDALDAGVRGQMVKASDRAGLKAAIATIADQGRPSNGLRKPQDESCRRVLVVT
jgi:predicted dehydrogenase